MALTSKQRREAESWRQDETQKRWEKENRHTARCLRKYLRDIVGTGCPEVDDKLTEMGKMAREIEVLLEAWGDDYL